MVFTIEILWIVCDPTVKEPEAIVTVFKVASLPQGGEPPLPPASQQGWGPHEMEMELKVDR